LVAEGQGAWAEARDRLMELQRRLEPSDPRQGMIRGRLEAVEKRLGGGAVGRSP